MAGAGASELSDIEDRLSETVLMAESGASLARNCFSIAALSTGASSGL